MTLQKRVCDRYHLVPCNQAKEQFQSSYNSSFEKSVDFVIARIFKDLKSDPVRCTTFEKSAKAKENLIPYNFVLENGKTLSIRTSKSNKMVAPRVVGQAGYDVLNSFFEDVIGEHLFSQEQIRKVIFNNIQDMLPTFVSYLLNSDYTVWVYPSKAGTLDYIVFDNNTAVDIEYDAKNFSFTKSLLEWTESVTLKYKGLSIAEIQTHKNRTFKFRFNFPNLIKLFINEKTTTETLGITAEDVICNLFELDRPDSFRNRACKKLASDIEPIIKEAFSVLPKAIRHTGSDSGERKGASKCSYDFLLEGGLTLSVKTNIGKMVCPPEVGQPNDSTFYSYFKDLIDENYVDENIFKDLALTKTSEMMPIYTRHLFDSDYLLRIYQDSGQWRYQIFAKAFGQAILWDQSGFSFTKPTKDEWNESNTIKYLGKRIGEFQYHHHRNCYKFRFDFDNLISLIEEFVGDANKKNAG